MAWDLVASLPWGIASHIVVKRGVSLLVFCELLLKYRAHHVLVVDSCARVVVVEVSCSWTMARDWAVIFVVPWVGQSVKVSLLTYNFGL